MMHVYKRRRSFLAGYKGEIALALLVAANFTLAALMPEPAPDAFTCRQCGRTYNAGEMPEACQDEKLRWYCSPECQEDFNLLHGAR